MAKLYCVCDLQCFHFIINSSLAEIIVKSNTGAETIASSIIPGFLLAGFVVYDDWGP